MPTCQTGDLYLYGQCRGVGLALGALGISTQVEWQKLPNGTNQAVTEAVEETLDDFERLLKQERPAMTEFERLLSKTDGKVAVSEFEKLLEKDVLLGEARVASSAGILSRAVPVLNVAGLAYAGWELYEWGRVAMSANEVRDVMGGECPSGWSGPDCSAALAGNTEQYWPADDKPTYIWQPQNSAQPYVHHPLDQDRTVYDMTQTSPGKWEFVQFENGATGDIYLAPTVEYGPVLMERIDRPGHGRTVTITTAHAGNIRGYMPEQKPADFTQPGPVIIADPFVNPDPACTGQQPLPAPQHLPCRRAQPAPLTDPRYKPYPDPSTSPDPDTETQPDKLTAPQPAPTTSPLPYQQPQPDPATGKMPSPFKVPDLQPQPNADPDPDATPFGSCGCTLQPPDLNVPTLAETTDKLISDMAHGLGADVDIPDMTGDCPILKIEFDGSEFGVFQGLGTIQTDAHCQILEQNRVPIEAMAALLWLITGLMIVLGP
ncbi:hypothetical protein MKLM6_2302 [Methylomonas koyamae]|uniref:Uncharacterized protein n=1 Tax=Methylomonas koyamae TaxID=702114 RepID=A0A291IJE7_9GAMM|nr:hypothetical protein MKLM6_2302 [Methylomonas koyamae]OAI30066.1 hypothetical protein A1356_22510 [Methylomonas koyamae]